jgi:hypothetical protein
VSDDHEMSVVKVLQRALRIAKTLFNSEDPLLIMEIHDRLIARAHCCVIDGEADEDQSWK